MNLQVLVATMHQRDLSLYEKMNIRCSAVIANQAEDRQMLCQSTPYGEVQMITTPTVGVGLNRNAALLLSQGDVLLFADDDVIFEDDMPKEVIGAFERLPQADVIVFGLRMVKNGEVIETRRMKQGRLRVYNSMRYGTCRIAVRREAYLRANLSFHQMFGGGCPFSAGEDSLFLKSCFDKGLRVYGYDYVLVFTCACVGKYCCCFIFGCNNLSLFVLECYTCNLCVCLAVVGLAFNNCVNDCYALCDNVSGCFVCCFGESVVSIL